MRKSFLATGAALLLGLLSAGCIDTSRELERDAARHQYWAERAAARGDYESAAAHQRHANQLRRQAVTERNYLQDSGYDPSYPHVQPTQPPQQVIPAPPPAQ